MLELANEEVLVDFTMANFIQTGDSAASLRNKVAETIHKYVQKEISYEEATDIIAPLVDVTNPLEKLKNILDVGNTPLPEIDLAPETGGSKRKKTRTWTNTEDDRLIMGVAKHGTDSWSQIAAFVGNSRTRSQCSQRWVRVLDPKINKSHFTPEEDRKLLQLVEQFGTKMWTKVAGEMGNRSDVQCRYRYSQLPHHEERINEPLIPKVMPTAISFIPPPKSSNQIVPNTSIPQAIISNLPIPQTSYTPMPSGSPPKPLPILPITKPSLDQSMEEQPKEDIIIPLQKSQMHPHFDPAVTSEPKNISLDAPIPLRGSLDFFRSDQLFDSSFWN